MPADGSRNPIDISNSGYGDYIPRWALDGGAVLWTTDRFGQKNHGSWGGEFDVLAAFTNQEAFDAFTLKGRTRGAQGRGDKDKKKDDDEDEDSDDEDNDGEDEEQDEEPLEIDFEGLEDRTVRLTIHSSDLGSFELTHEGKVLLYLARFEKGFDLWAHDFVEESTKLISKLGARRAAFEVVEDGKAVFVLADGSLKKISISRSDDKGPSAGDTKGVSIAPEMNLRPDEEFAYLFDHVWRQVEQKFYDPDLHGVDWDFYREQYAAKLDGITNARDFAEMLSELLGELNASHTGGYYTGASGTVPTASLGFFPDHEYDGDGLRIAEILPRGPLADAELEIEEDMVITAIDGTELGDGVNVYELLAGKVGDRVRLTFDGETDKVVTPISLGREFGLRYDRWVQQRRELVEELSTGASATCTFAA